MKRYTIGVVFSPNGKEVLLQLKNRPKWQEGKYNFPGGKVEEDETIQRCIVREFKEECGIYIEPGRWYYQGMFSGNEELYNGGGDYQVHIFVTQIKNDEKPFANEDQPINWFLNNSIPDNSIPNLHWIISLILNNAKFFNIEY